jgi:hypothetical protein
MDPRVKPVGDAEGVSSSLEHSLVRAFSTRAGADKRGHTKLL